MRRLLALVTFTSVAVAGLVGVAAPTARATPLPLAIGGCTDSPLALSDTAAISRTCASWDGANLAIWVEGAGLAQEFTAVGSANVDLFGYVLVLEARAGMRHAPYGAWEAFAELTKPFAWGPITIPLQVAEDGTRVTLWLSTAALTAHRAGVGADATSGSFTLAFTGPDGTTGGTVAVPLNLTPVRPPAPPTPDLYPSAHRAPAPAVASPTRGPAAATPTTHLATPPPTPTPAAAAAPHSPTRTRIAPDRAALGRY